MIAATDPQTATALQEAEQAFFRGERRALDGYLVSANAVRWIITEELWRSAAESLEAYCTERLGISISNAFTRMYCLDLYDEMRDAKCEPLPTTLTQLTALVSAKVNGCDVLSLWREAVEIASHRSRKRGQAGGPLINRLARGKKHRRKGSGRGVQHAITEFRDSVWASLKEDGSERDKLLSEILESLDVWERRLLSLGVR